MDTEFNVEQFLNETVDAAELDTQRIPVPSGEYLGQIGTEKGDVDLKTGLSKKNQKPWMALQLKVRITDANLAAQLKRDPNEPIVLYYNTFVDLNEQGKTDWRPQKNINLGKIRSAVGQNKAGPWSFMQLAGQPVKVSVKQKPGEDGEPRSEIVAFAKAM
jgi:hypothetical protein